MDTRLPGTRVYGEMFFEGQMKCFFVLQVEREQRGKTRVSGGGEEIENQDARDMATETLRIFTKLVQVLVQMALSGLALCWA